MINNIDDLIKKLVDLHKMRTDIWELIANQHIPENEKKALFKSLDIIGDSIVQQSKKIEL